MGALFLTILELSLEGALLIGLILLLRPLSGTYFSAKWRCLVWLILALRQYLYPLDPQRNFYRRLYFYPWGGRSLFDAANRLPSVVPGGTGGL